MTNDLTYIVNDSGERLYVQIPMRDWDRLMSERKRLLSEAKFKKSLKLAIEESERIRKGEVKAVSFSEFLNEL